MKKVYVVGGKVVATGWAAGGAQVTIAPADGNALVLDMDMASPVDVGWTMTEGEDGRKFSAPIPPPPTIGPNEFHFLWTMQEQIAIEELRTSDPVVKLFMRRLDDVRTTEVVLADPSVQAAVRHTVAGLMKMGVIEADKADERAEAIISGGRK
jgi:hypothetical protein